MLRMGVVSTAVCAGGTDNLLIIHEKVPSIKQFRPQKGHLWELLNVLGKLGLR